MKSFLDEAAGIYDNSRKFAVTNITDDEFVSYWDGHPFKIPPHETIELPHHLAVKVTGEIVDKIMIGIGTQDIERGREKKGDFYYRSPVPANAGIPIQRKKWEDKVMVEIQEEDNNSAQTMAERAQLISQLKRDFQNEPSTAPPTFPGEGEFSMIKKKNEILPPAEKNPINFKKINAVPNETSDSKTRSGRKE